MAVRDAVGRSARRFSVRCRRCPRLATWLEDIRVRYPAYHGRPVPAFGSAAHRFLVVGLAPGLHGANATGRPFTGDYAGVLLYRTLHEFGFASLPVSESASDALELRDCVITNAVRCVPPANRPVPEEVRTCNPYLVDDLRRLSKPGIVLALGRIAHDATLLALGAKRSRFAFGHGQWHQPAPGIDLVDSYHCSRYNTQTRRLTEAMFRTVVSEVRDRLDRP